MSESSNIKTYFEQLQKECEKIFSDSLSKPNIAMVADSHQFVNEIECWFNILHKRRESELLSVAALEYNFALFSLTQGHYRHAFKGLRLVLELILQAVCLSVDELSLREWLDNRKDTIWNAIIHEEKGIFSQRFARAFFPELTRHVQHYRGLASAVYRECSECVHGNTAKQVPLPKSLQFEQETFDIWHAKASNVILVAHFALSLRYLPDLEEKDIDHLEPSLSARVGHIAEIRRILGGPTEG